MKLPSFLLLGCVLMLSSCTESERLAALPENESVSLVGKQVSIAFNRAALGLATDVPLSRQTGTYNGVQMAMSGKVVSQTPEFLVISTAPGGNDHDNRRHWIPISSILSVREKGTSEAGELEDKARPESWRLEALHNLLGMVEFPLKDLPQGDVKLWFVKDGKSSFLDEISVTPGFDQWICVGVDPIASATIFMSVVSEESKGGSYVSLPVGKITPLHTLIKPGHDWTKSAAIAAEGSGDGKLWAQLKAGPKK